MRLSQKTTRRYLSAALFLLFEFPPNTRPQTAPPSPMVLVHGGDFSMGIDESEIPYLQKLFHVDAASLFHNEVPKHRVHVRDFYIDKTLVTNAQFRSFIDANPQLQFSELSSTFDNGNYLRHWAEPDNPLANPVHPVVNVNWFAAVAYCHRAGRRLPSEAEWEFAARAGRNTLFPWGDDPPNTMLANFNNNLGTTTPVENYPANALGLFDMGGNVWQWLADRWAPYPSASDKPDKNQKGKKKTAGSFADQDLLDVLVFHSTRHVIRGGSFQGAAVNLWVEYRDSHPANGSADFVGFRCAKSAD